MAKLGAGGPLPLTARQSLRKWASARRPAAVVPAHKRRPCKPLDPMRPLPAVATWYVLEVAPQREYRVAHWLEAMGFASLVPLETRTRIARGKTRSAGRKKQAREIYQLPLIPRMVLLGTTGPLPWLTILDHQHVTGAIGIDGMPLAMRAGEAERLQAASEYLRLLAAPRPLKIGSRAYVTKPGWAGRIVEITDLPERGRWARVKGCFAADPERIAVVDREELEAA